MFPTPTTPPATAPLHTPPPTSHDAPTLAAPPNPLRLPPPRRPTPLPGGAAMPCPLAPMAVVPVCHSPLHDAWAACLEAARQVDLTYVLHQLPPPETTLEAILLADVYRLHHFYGVIEAKSDAMIRDDWNAIVQPLGQLCTRIESHWQPLYDVGKERLRELLQQTPACWAKTCSLYLGKDQEPQNACEAATADEQVQDSMVATDAPSENLKQLMGHAVPCVFDSIAFTDGQHRPAIEALAVAAHRGHTLAFCLWCAETQRQKTEAFLAIWWQTPATQRDVLRLPLQHLCRLQRYQLNQLYAVRNQLERRIAALPSVPALLRHHVGQDGAEVPCPVFANRTAKVRTQAQWAFAHKGQKAHVGLLEALRTTASRTISMALCTNAACQKAASG